MNEETLPPVRLTESLTSAWDFLQAARKEAGVLRWHARRWIGAALARYAAQALRGLLGGPRWAAPPRPGVERRL